MLTSAEVEPLLRAAVEHGGGVLVSWHLDHVDAHPHHSTTATFAADVQWPFGRRAELLGASARVGKRTTGDERAVIFADGAREVAVWLYPRDPDLPGLIRAAYPDSLAEVLDASGVVDGGVTADRLQLTMIGYRPRRRAVLRATVSTASGPVTFYVKALRQHQLEPTRQRHELLCSAGIPAPDVAAVTDDGLLVLRELPGRPLAGAIFDAAPACSAETLVALLDALPPAVAALPRRPPWVDAVEEYAAMVALALPSLMPRLDRLAGEIRSGLATIPSGAEPTHGDFHEGQLFLTGPRVSGLLDVDTVGPGRRADDLACLVAHLSTVQRMNAQQAARVSRLLHSWVPVFDARVDPYELRLRAAGVIISLATGPYRGQEPAWPRETEAMIATAELLVRQLG